VRAVKAPSGRRSLRSLAGVPDPSEQTEQPGEVSEAPRSLCGHDGRILEDGVGAHANALGVEIRKRARQCGALVCVVEYVAAGQGFGVQGRNAEYVV